MVMGSMGVVGSYKRHEGVISSRQALFYDGVEPILAAVKPKAGGRVQRGGCGGIRRWPVAGGLAVVYKRRRSRQARCPAHAASLDGRNGRCSGGWPAAGR